MDLGDHAVGFRLADSVSPAVIHFSTGMSVHSCAAVDQHVYANHPHIYPQRVTLADRQGRDRSMLSCWPWFPLPACRAVIAPCLDRNADHAQDVPEAPRDSSLAQVAQLSLRVCNAVACRGDAAPHPGPPSETGDQGGHLLARAGTALPRNLPGPQRLASLVPPGLPLPPRRTRGGARPGRYPHAASWRRDGPGKVRIEHPLNTVCSIAVQQPGHTPPIERDHYFRRREQRNDLR